MGKHLSTPMLFEILRMVKVPTLPWPLRFRTMPWNFCRRQRFDLQRIELMLVCSFYMIFVYFSPKSGCKNTNNFNTRRRFSAFFEIFIHFRSAHLGALDGLLKPPIVD